MGSVTLQDITFAASPKKHLTVCFRLLRRITEAALGCFSNICTAVLFTNQFKEGQKSEYGGSGGPQLKGMTKSTKLLPGEDA